MRLASWASASGIPTDGRLPLGQHWRERLALCCQSFTLLILPVEVLSHCAPLSSSCLVAWVLPGECLQGDSSLDWLKPLSHSYRELVLAMMTPSLLQCWLPCSSFDPTGCWANRSIANRGGLVEPSLRSTFHYFACPQECLRWHRVRKLKHPQQLKPFLQGRRRAVNGCGP